MESIRGLRIGLHSGYNQLRAREDDQPKTAFKCRFGHFQFTVTPLGLTNLPASFHELLVVCVLSDIDGILIYSPNLEQHIIDVEKVLKLLTMNKLFVKLKKCELFQDNVTFLGHKLSAEGLSVKEDKVKAIMAWSAPRNVEQVQSYLGTVGYYRKFIKDFGKKSAPLSHLFKKGVNWQWKRSQENAFNELKRLFRIHLY